LPIKKDDAPKLPSLESLRRNTDGRPARIKIPSNLKVFDSILEDL
jgi:hypothetical protein